LATVTIGPKLLSILTQKGLDKSLSEWYNRYIKRRKEVTIMKDTKTTYTIGFCDLLAVLFIALKLCKVISWSWLWVLSPIWIPLALSIVIYVIILIASWF
jgi:hypothetical protein